MFVELSHAPDEYKPQERSPSAPLSDTSEINVEYLTEDDSTCSRPATPGASDEDEVEKKRKKVCEEVSDFIDLDYWKRETLCCGTIFRGIIRSFKVLL
ncbi:hypothetical protein NQ315_012596 [Exocentrus adspersus]|uniref:Uncharacterized protein n=1 Tax=Exocentrus adspersus TaxID=1586481 RepID=A0AAV8VT68_9CUCU|nr:hypothetical protein NQ315_012596 [Exocentrus adspersus]